MGRRYFNRRTAALIALATFATRLQAAPFALTGTSYLQNFDGIGSGLPTGWSLTTNADSGSIGTSAGLVTAATAWSSTTGNFKNVASSDGLTAASIPSDQAASTDRALGIRQIQAFGDPGAAFNFEINDTINLTSFSLSFKAEMLSVQTRSTTWSLQYGLGSSPTSFTTLATYSDPGTFGSMTINAGSAISGIANQSQNVWIRVVALSPSTGSNFRDTFAINDFNMSWISAPPITASWVGANTSNWTTPGNWSTNPDAPNNGSPNVGSNYDAVIDATGASYTVTLDSDITVNSLRLNSASATLNQSAGTFKASAITLQAGTYLMSGGTISGSTVNGAGGTFAVAPGANATLNGVTLNADLTVNNATLNVVNGLAIGNHTVSLNAVTQNSFANIDSISGVGTVIFNGSLDGSVIGGQGSAGGALAIGPGITLLTGTAGGSVVAANLTNSGTLLAQTAGKTLNVAGNNSFANSGLLRAASGATLSIGGILNAGGLNNIDGAAGTIQLTGTLINSGNTLNLSSAAQRVFLNGGDIFGGTISTANSGTVLLSSGASGTFDGVTLASDFALSGSGTLNAFNGLTLNNQTLFLNSAPASQHAAANIGTLTGTGTLIFNGTADDASVGGQGIAGGSLTVDTGITVRTGTAGGSITAASVFNDGTIAAQTAGKTLAITASSSFTNVGTVTAGSGGTVLAMSPSLSGTLTSGHYYVFDASSISFGSSTITTNAADIRLDGATSRFDAINNLLTNNGTFTVANGRLFNIASTSFVNNGTLNADNGGTITIPGGTNNGTINALTGGTIIFSGSFLHNTNSFLNGSGSVIFNGGTQTFNGTIVGDINLTLVGAANFGPQSKTIIKTLNIQTADTLISPGAQLIVGTTGLPGQVTFSGNSSPTIALTAGDAGAGLVLGNSNISVTTTGGIAQILTAGSGAQDGQFDLGGATRTITFSPNRTLLITAQVADGALSTSGAGLLELTRSNTYAGGTTITTGTVQITDTHALGTGSVLFQDGTLDIRSDSATTTIGNSLNAGAANSMFLHIDRITNPGPTGTFVTTGINLGTNLTVAGNGNLQIPSLTLGNNAVIENFVPLEIAGPISGNFGITRGGSGGSSGSLTFSGNSNNTYTGLTTLTRGGLVLNKTGGAIAVPHDLQVLGGAAQTTAAGEISSSSNVTVSDGATLTLGGAETFASLSLSGLLQSNSNLTVTTQFSDTNGSLTGSGTLNLPSTATSTITTSFAPQHTINNSGTFNLPGSSFGGASAGPPGFTFNNLAGGIVNGIAGSTIYASQFGASTFNNAGILSKTGAGGMIFSDFGNNNGTLVFPNSGAINVHAGSLAILASQFTNSGSINVDAGATINFGSFTTTATSIITGPGAFNFNGAATIPAGVFTPSGPVGIVGGSVAFNGAQSFGVLSISGTLSGSGDVQVGSSLTMSGALLNGSGTLDITNSAIANIAGSVSLQRTLNNAGVTNLATGAGVGNTSGVIGFVLNNASTGVINASGTTSIYANAPGSSTFINAGTVNKTGAGSLTIGDFGGGNGTLVFSNSGTLNVNAGSVAITASSASSSGTINVAAGAAISFGSFTFGPGSVINGPGAIAFNGSTTIPAGVLATQGLVSIGGGTVAFNAAQNFAQLTITAGTLAGAGDITVSTLLTATGGAVSGSGALILPATATGNVSGLTLQRAVNNSGTFNASGVVIPQQTFTNSGVMNLASGAIFGNSGSPSGFTLNNTATGVINASNNAAIYSNFPGASTFNNAGTFNKTGSGATIISDAGAGGTLVFSNSGSINVNAGSLTIAAASATNSGTIFVAGGATISLGNFNFLPSSVLAGPGVFNFIGSSSIPTGALTDSKAISISNGMVVFNDSKNLDTLSLSSGTLAGAGDVSVGVSFTASNGGATGSGALNLLSSTTSTLTNFFSLQRPLNNSGTLNVSGNLLPQQTITNSGIINLGSGLTIGNLNTGAGFTINNLAGGVINASSNVAVISNTPGASTFNNAGAFNKSSTGSLIFSDFGGSGTLVFANSGSFNVSNGPVSIAASTIVNSGLMQASSGTILFSHPPTNSGSLMTSGSGVIRIGGLSGAFTNAGTIDISGGGAVFEYSTTSPFNSIKSQILTGYAAGAWNGIGINSSAARQNTTGHPTAVGYAEASAIGITSNGAFLGGTVDSTSVLLRYVYSGDSNLDGIVNTSDFTRMASHFNQPNSVWSDGDSNYDGVVNALDFNLLASDFGQSLSSPALGLPNLGQPLPEPFPIFPLVLLFIQFGRRTRHTS